MRNYVFFLVSYNFFCSSLLNVLEESTFVCFLVWCTCIWQIVFCPEFVWTELSCFILNINLLLFACDYSYLPWRTGEWLLRQQKLPFLLDNMKRWRISLRSSEIKNITLCCKRENLARYFTHTDSRMFVASWLNLKRQHRWFCAVWDSHSHLSAIQFLTHIMFCSCLLITNHSSLTFPPTIFDGRLFPF